MGQKVKDTGLISLKKYQEVRETNRAELEFSNYLDILSFNELINEATALKNELENRPLDKELTGRSQIIFSQFIKRLQIESPSLASTLRTAQSNSKEQLAFVL